MELSNEVEMALPPDEAWRALTDLERIAPCMPGADLQEIDGEEFRGVVKVKLGPLTAQYRGAMRVLEQDPEVRRVVIRAEGRETRGRGRAKATVTATMAPRGRATTLTVVADLDVSGAVADLGADTLRDAGQKLLQQLCDCVAAGQPVPASGPTAAPLNPSVGPIGSAASAPAELVSAAGGALAKRLVGPVIAGLFVLSWVWRRRRRHG